MLVSSEAKFAKFIRVYYEIVPIKSKNILDICCVLSQEWTDISKM